MLKAIPNFVTLLNLCCGFIGLVFAFNEMLHYASIMMFIAMVLDYLDGALAKLLNAQSEMGVQLDSLADLVTFGVLPAVIMFQMLLVTTGNYFDPVSAWFGVNNMPWIALLLAVSACWRLARFNVDRTPHRHFVGLPVPAMALFVSGIPLMLELQFKINFYVPIDGAMFEMVAKVQRWDAFERWMVHLLLNPSFYVVCILLLSALMVSPLSMLDLKFKGFGWRQNRHRYWILILVAIAALVVLIPYWFWVPLNYSYIDYIIIPTFVSVYVLFSIIYTTFFDKNRQTQQE